MRFSRVAIVLVVVVIVVVACFAFLGTSYLSDFIGGPSGGPTAYATFSYEASVSLYIPTTTSSSDWPKVTNAEVTRLTADVEPYQGPDQGRVVAPPSNPLKGGAKMIGQIWFHIEVTGTKGYKANWTSDKTALIGTTSPQIFGQSSGRCFFDHNGEYTVSLFVNVDLLDMVGGDYVWGGIVTYKTVTFEVNV